MRLPTTPRGWNERRILSGRKVADRIAGWTKFEALILDNADMDWLCAYVEFLLLKATEVPDPPRAAVVIAMAKASGGPMAFCELGPVSRQEITAYLRSLIEAAPKLATKWRMAA